MSNNKKSKRNDRDAAEPKKKNSSLTFDSKGRQSDVLSIGDIPAVAKTIDLKSYERELRLLQIELIKLQEWVKQEGKRVTVIFEGRDAAGKGGAIKRIAERMNPRVCRIVALSAPSGREKSQWYFQRYVEQLPAAGEMVLMDRSWYNRAGVERVMNFCSEEEYHEFLVSCPEFERLLVRSGLILKKYWFSISAEEQERRFQKRLKDPTKHWKLSDMDLASRQRWNEYSHAKDLMMQHTDTQHAPWYVVEADNKRRARLNCIRHLLSSIRYSETTPVPPDGLPGRPPETPVARSPKAERNIIPEVF
jgi:polyphosphate kinase 2